MFPQKKKKKKLMINNESNKKFNYGAECSSVCMLLLVS